MVGGQTGERRRPVSAAQNGSSDDRCAGRARDRTRDARRHGTTAVRQRRRRLRGEADRRPRQVPRTDPTLGPVGGGMKAANDCKVLVGEGDPLFQRILYKRRGAEGYQVSAASDGREGMKAIVTFEPDLVVSDWMMPEVDGLEIC